ncbi:MAG: hypothetical protein ACRDHE_08605 [Ktedonobacterales bacterium]
MQPLARLLTDDLPLIRTAVTGLGILLVVCAPLLAWIAHKRRRVATTRSSMTIATLGNECLAVGLLCFVAASWAANFILSTALIVGGALLMLASPLVLSFIGRTSQQRNSLTGTIGESDQSPGS